MASATSTQPGRLIKMSLFIKKREDRSYEDFHKHWSETHSKLFATIPITRQKIVKYSQTHSDSSVDLSQYGLIKSGYDGIAEFWARSLEDLEAVFNDPEYLSIVYPDEENFFHRTESTILYGWEEIKAEDGKVLI
ncbi:hypothetical protein GGR54DRAFT_636607 [Hypoxylon sp. NC1633]|nr:hypothetical protein GGR54DRAFT_636607 [Hypoxylon sp. NC1633]